jgi:hypothetical protein
MECITSTFCTEQQTKKEASTATQLLFFFLLLLVLYGLLHHADHCACCLLGLLSHPDDGGGMFLQNINIILPDHMVSHPRRPEPYSDVVHHVLCAASHQERLHELQKPMNIEREICYQEKFLIAPGNKLTTFITHTCRLFVSAALTLKARLLSSHPPCQW